jgi:hypothetical protein
MTKTDNDKTCDVKSALSFFVKGQQFKDPLKIKKNKYTANWFRDAKTEAEKIMQLQKESCKVTK